MKWIIGFYGIQLIILVVLIMASWLIWDKRFKKRHGKDIPPGFVRTNEISIDPTTGKKLVVYYHPGSGERFYKEE